MRKPLNIDKSGCSSVSSNCVTWQGPNIECLGLCKGDSVTEVVYELATLFCQFMEQFNVEQYDLSCMEVACPPKTFKELFQLVITTMCQIQVQDGDNGINGNYTTVEAFAPGLHSCTNGGIDITTFNGETNAQINQYFICNPVDGTDGDPGPPGIRGDYVQISAATTEQCPAGGIVVTLLSGEDDSIISTNPICNAECDCTTCDGFTVTITENSGDLVATPSGGTGPYTYQWEMKDVNLSTGVSAFTISGSSTSQTVSVSASSGTVIEPATAYFSGMIKVTVTDTNGCVTTDYFHIKDVILS